MDSERLDEYLDGFQFSNTLTTASWFSQDDGASNIEANVTGLNFEDRINRYVWTKFTTP